MKQTTVQKQVRKASGSEIDSEVVQKAYRLKNRLEKNNEVPKKYLEIIDEIRSRINQHAYTFIPRLYFALRKAGFDIEAAKLMVIADGMKSFGWKYNTIRTSIPSEAKNQTKAKGGRAAAVKRVENRKARQSKIENGNGHDINPVEAIVETTVQKLSYVLSRDTVNKISDISETSLQSGGSGDVKIQFENENFINASAFK